MLFNSLTYAIFLPIVFIIYWLLRRHIRWQNLFVVAASYVFYGWWDWRFLCLIALTSFLSWGSGIQISRSKRPKMWLAANIVLNIGILAVFKYYDFFVGSFCSLFGIDAAQHLLNLILPVGISFYTFQALSYSMDVYRSKIAPTRDIVAFFAYVSFFPQLVAGPIERATNLLPQFEHSRTFDYNQAVDGLRRILWGLFKKVVIADNCALYVDQVWADYTHQSGSTLAIAAILFAFQIYGDFSGYSDIAIGTAKLFGINLRDNFRMPYFSRSVAEFWKRWHISLNTWFVDYVYIPLGGSREGMGRTIFNTFVIFLLSGLWHGANWTYVGWGAYHALLFVPLILLHRTKLYRDTATWRQLPQMLLTFILVVVGWILFRAPSIADAWGYFIGICNESLFTMPLHAGSHALFINIGLMLLVEWLQRYKQHAMDIEPIKYMSVRWVIYLVLLFIIFSCGGNAINFIYFQF